VVVVCGLAQPSALVAAPLGTGFTYQGQLQQNGSALNGNVDLSFTLWDAQGSGSPPAGGNQLGAAAIVLNTPVASGVFSVILNSSGQFGANPFNGDARWLQIAVRPAGGGTYTTLSPRQAITATPYALQTRGIVVTDAGNVAIGGVGPNARLHVAAPGAGAGNNTAEFDAFAIGPNASHIHYGTTGDWYIRSASASGKVVIQDSGGNLGVGTASPQGRIGVVASDQIGVHSFSSNIAIQGTSGSQRGVVGLSTNSVGVEGRSTESRGVHGESINNIGVMGQSFGSSGRGVLGTATWVGVHGVAQGSESDRQAVRGDNFDAPTGYAGYFVGNVHVTGTLTKSAGTFKIDHPLDPANKTLTHAFVESPDMMNIYNGNIVSDERGYAEVVLPDWFEALNRDFRYQLTVLDDGDSPEFVQAKVVRKVAGNHFALRTSQPGVEVSWQVTGIRRDAYAVANPIAVEEYKPANQRGRYLAPAAHGAPVEMGIGFLKPAADTVQR